MERLFFFSSDLESGDEDLQGLDGIDWYGIYGPEWWLQLLRDFDCTVTSTWVDAVKLGESHTWRAWGSRVRKKQLDYIMRPRDLFEQVQNSHLGLFSGGGEDCGKGDESEEAVLDPSFGK